MYAINGLHCNLLFRGNETNVKWTGRVVEKYSTSFISSGEPDDSFKLKSYYQGASGAVVGGKNFFEEIFGNKSNSKER